MIEGLHIEISSEELKRHIAERAVHHRQRAEWYGQQAKQIEAGHVRSTDRHARTFDPLEGLLSKQQEHQQKCAFFQFVAEHIIPNEVYRLKEEDLARLEVFSRYF